MLTLGFLKNIFFLPILAATFLSFIAVPAVIQIASYFGLLDDPHKRPHPAHTETRVIPRAGGLAIFFGFALAAIIFIPFSKQIFGMVLGAALLVVIGLVDDYKDVNPYVRLFGGNLAAALLAVGAGAGIPYITNPFGAGVIHLDFWRVTFTFLGTHGFYPLADGAAVLWIMWAMNMVGWSGGVDGQLPGFVSVSAFFIGVLSLSQIGIDNFPSWVVATLAFITSGAYLGFLPWNIFPQKIMPGYGGKSLAGFLLATISVLSVTKIGTAILVLGVPMIDAIYVLIMRLVNRRQAVAATRSHFHHRLLDAGWSKRQVALFYWTVSAILGVLALLLNGRQKFFVGVVLVVLFFALVVWLNLYTRWRKRSALDNGLKT